MAAQANGSPRLIPAGAPALTDLQLDDMSDSIASNSANTSTTTAAPVKSRSLSNPPVPIFTSSQSPSRRIIGGSTARALRHTASQHLLSSSPTVDYLQPPQYSAIAEERESHLHSSTGDSRSHDQPPSAGPSARSLPGGAHSQSARATSMPHKVESAEARSPRRGRRRSIGGEGSIISEYGSGADDAQREESHFFDELPMDFNAPMSQTTGGSGRDGKGSKTGGGRRFSDDYSTYKQKQIAARQDKKFQEKMRLQKSMNAGVHARGAGTLVEKDELPFGFIHPSSTFFRFWKIFLLVSVWYSCFETSFIVSFDILCAFPHSYSVLVVLNCIVDAAMLGDIWVYSRKGYYDETLELHSSATAIRRKYARSWLLLDLAAALPLEFVQAIIIASTSDGVSHSSINTLTFQLLKLGRVLKMLKVINFSQTRKSLEINETVRTFFAFVYLILIGHLVACGWHLLARLEELYSPRYVHVDLRRAHRRWQQDR